jgi:hypothetical protein
MSVLFYVCFVPLIILSVLGEFRSRLVVEHVEDSLL